MRQSARRQAGTTCNPESGNLTGSLSTRLLVRGCRVASTERQVSGMILPLCFSDPRSSSPTAKSDRLPPFAGPVFPRRSVPLSAWALFVRCADRMPTFFCAPTETLDNTSYRRFR